MPQFVHLHVHTQYSILDGASNIKTLFKKAKELGMPAIAITDHGNMFGAKLFHQEASKIGIKPILGCEVYVADKGRFDKSDKDDRGGHHLILLAKNLIGYHNLIKLVSYSWTEGYYYKPRVDKELLEKYREGIICSSACLGGEIPQAILNGNIDKASEIIEQFKGFYGEDFYLELQLHKPAEFIPNNNVHEEQLEVNKAILGLARKHGVKCIATNDIHFVNSEDAEAHDRLICLNTGKDLDDPKRMRYTKQEYLKSSEEMEALFPGEPELLSNTIEIADKIEHYNLSHSAFMPNFPLPEDFIIETDDIKQVFGDCIENYMSQTTDESLITELQQLLREIASCDCLEQMDAVAIKSWSDKIEAETKYIISKQFLYLRYITIEGAKARYVFPFEDHVIDRILFELKTIERMGFPGYFLIVWDFIRAGREMGVAVGPGRGSAAGSVVAYCLGITNIDPIKYDLLFERFLNPERISMPDIDIDFDEDGREKVMKYVVDKYGRKRVAHIITFGTMAAKMAIRDVARVQKLPLSESDRLAKLVPERPGTTLAKAYDEVPELKKERSSENKDIVSTLKFAETLEGSVRQTGVHACGVIIGKDDLENFIPMSIAKDADLYVVQYDGKHVEDIGLLKMDFLGLKTLSIIKDAVQNIKISKGKDIDIDTISLEDKETFELYSRGDTTGLFQFESPGMKKYLRDLQPNRFEDLIAMNALYRPGPLEYIPNFIARKQGREPIKYDLADMEEYLRDTYGITVYQEQVMLLSQKLAGFTKGQADTLRKAMGKKMKEVLAKMKGDFINGATERGHDPGVCEKVWTDWEAFASYAFNKSHATCYAYVSYQTAFLKTHYPAEFMAALLSRNLSDISKISLFMDECKRMGLPVKGPDVNASLHHFSVDKRSNVRFGLGAIKGVGEAAVAYIVDEREKNGEYKDIYDFVERVSLQTVNKKTIENLALAGAFDSMLDFPRSVFFAQGAKDSTFVEMLVRYGNVFTEQQNSSQASLFGDTMQSDMIHKPEIPKDAQEWGMLETLNKEKELVGIYLSSHPLDNYRPLINNFATNTLEQLLNDKDALRDKDFTVCGIVTKVVNATTKKGTQFGKVIVEDYNGSYEFAFFGKDYEDYRPYCFEGYQLIIRGRFIQRYEGAEYSPKVTSIMTLRDAQERLIKDIMVYVPVDIINRDFTESLAAVIDENKGSIDLKIRLFDTENAIGVNMLSRTKKINISNELISFIEDNKLHYKLN